MFTKFIKTTKKIFLYLTLLTFVFAIFSCESANANASDSTTTTQNPSKPDETQPEPNETTEPDEPNSPTQNLELSYKERLERNLTGITPSDFTKFLINLPEYENNCQVAVNAIFASPNGNGNGTFEKPCSLQDALDDVKKGQTLYLRGGEYFAPTGEGFFINCKGEKNNFITIRNYPGETVKIKNANKGKESYAFQFDAKTCYVIFEGIEICEIEAENAYGIVFWGDGQNNIVIRNCNIHDIKTTSTKPDTDENASANAILLNGEKTNPISNIAILDNNCHDNVTGWAETVSVAGNCESVYIIRNCIENNTNIGIDFYGNAGYCKEKSLDQPRFCLAADNFITKSYCTYADCAGLYVDGARDIILQYNTITESQYGIEIVSEERVDEYPVKNIIVRYNECKNNKLVGIRIGGYEKEKPAL